MGARMTPVERRAADPAFAAFVDDIREVFGEGINATIKKGVAGIPGCFYYSGPAGEVGTPSLPIAAGKAISVADMVLESINPMKAENADRNHRR
jgi:hypothetical protein